MTAPRGPAHPTRADDPALPVEDVKGETFPGVTARVWVATHLLAGMLAAGNDNSHMADRSRRALQHADWLLCMDTDEAPMVPKEDKT